MPLYYLKRLSPTQPPPHGEESPWYQYEIACEVPENKNICGLRAGQRAEVEEYLNKMLCAINKRTCGHQSKTLRHAHNAPFARGAVRQYVPVGVR